MEQVGKIEKIEGNKAIISVKRVSSCGDNCKSCGSSCRQPSVMFETEISGDYEVGDYVEITTENSVVLKQILMLYGIPFVIMLITIGIVQLIFMNNANKDMISAVASIASLAVSYFILKAYDKKEMKKNTLKFTLGKKL
ncbi:MULTISPECIES: SoxR reducing system RseC family protein [unclassified Sedimentibacter]|uniref:SoxR reducing system RseC family protein n=1 Tax=unclassified Sedimentibacter TaxID=2649220 RepID=UPI0027E1D61B|nr:SoxR reducing system RseC family protein [Sedimentibacter sp. MB35-C1]WMJ75831.1 SoxR reducing system RseC family protein [Sedimentibacter sp. MB35-C1]